MSRQSKQKTRPKRLLWILLTVTLILVSAGAVLWLTVHHIPAWYKPVHVPEARMDEVRADAIRSYNRFGDGLVHRKTFDLTVGEEQVSRWITARERIWPESGGWVPHWVHDPIVRFRDGHIIVAARVDLEGHQFIGGAYISVEVGSDDILVIRLDQAAAGSLPLPLGVLAGPLASLLRLEGHNLDLLPAPVADTAKHFRKSEPMKALSQGLRRANRFIWQNGHRPYRIHRLMIADGNLTLTIEPL